MNKIYRWFWCWYYYKGILYDYEYYIKCYSGKGGYDILIDGEFKLRNKNYKKDLNGNVRK